MKISQYFEQFYNMEPYFEINEEQWEHIKETYPKDEVRLEMAKCARTYPLPYADISEDDARKDYMRLKGIRWNEILTEGEWFPRKAQESRYPYTYEGKQLYFSRLNTGNKASNYFQQENRWSVDGVIAPGPNGPVDCGGHGERAEPDFGPRAMGGSKVPLFLPFCIPTPLV